MSDEQMQVLSLKRDKRMELHPDTAKSLKW